MNDIYDLTHHLQEERKQTGTMTVDVTISHSSALNLLNITAYGIPDSC